MIIEEERDIEEDQLDLNEEASTYSVQAATISSDRENPEMEEVLNRDEELRDCPAHKQLQEDLIEHIWQKFGHTYSQNN
jgi:hypothetical protein